MQQRADRVGSDLSSGRFLVNGAGGAPGHVRETRHAEGDAVVLSTPLIDLGQLLTRSGEADGQALHLAGPTVAACFVDPGPQIALNLEQAGVLGWIGAKHRAADAGVLVDTRGAERAPTGAQRDFAPLEVSEELLPLRITGGAVFLTGPGGPAAGDEGAVTHDGLFGIDRLVTHCGVDVGMSDNELGDVRRHAVEHSVGDEDSPEVVGDEMQGPAVDSDKAGGNERGVEQLANRRGADRPGIGADVALKQDGQGRIEDAARGSRKR